MTRHDVTEADTHDKLTGHTTLKQQEEENLIEEPLLLTVIHLLTFYKISSVATNASCNGYRAINCYL